MRRNKVIMSFLCVTLFVFLATGSFGGDTQPDSQQIQEATAKVGDTITTNKFEIVVTSIEARTKVGTDFFNSTPAEGGIYVTVQWKYKNITSEPIGSLSTPSIRLIDKNNTRYRPDINASGNFATELNLDRKILSDLNPGITVKAAAVFEISKEFYEGGGWKLMVDADENAYILIN